MFWFNSPAQTIYPPHHADMKAFLQTVQAKKATHQIEFAFDIHKVLIHKDMKAEWRVFWHYPHKIDFLKCMIHKALLKDLGLMLWQLILNNWPWSTNYQDVTSAQVIHAFQKAGKPELADLFMKIVNEQNVDPAMTKLIKELKAIGYTLRIASNIGKTTFEQLKIKLAKENQNIFVYFDKDKNGLEGKTVDLDKSPAQKPHADYYHQYLTTYNPDNTKLIILIDDKLVNITAATQAGFAGIHFKNAQQLRNDLVLLTIL